MCVCGCCPAAAEPCLPLLLHAHLQLEGDAAHRATLDALHQVLRQQHTQQKAWQQQTRVKEISQLKRAMFCVTSNY
jgi:hypothetical protein